MILAGEITRDEALHQLERPIYNEDELGEDSQFVRKKLGFSEQEFTSLMNVPTKTHRDFPSDEKKYIAMKKLQSSIKRFLNKDLASYS